MLSLHSLYLVGTTCVFDLHNRDRAHPAIHRHTRRRQMRCVLWVWCFLDFHAARQSMYLRAQAAARERLSKNNSVKRSSRRPSQLLAPANFHRHTPSAFLPQSSSSTLATGGLDLALLSLYWRHFFRDVKKVIIKDTPEMCIFHFRLILL